MTKEREILRERAFRLFGRSMVRLDPGRLEAWVELGLTLTQLRVLLVLRAEDGASASVLAERLKVTPSPLTRIVARLVGQGLVRRETDDNDRRLVRHYLSANGPSTVEELERGGRARMNEVMDRLSDAQMERLGPGLGDFASALEGPGGGERSR